MAIHVEDRENSALRPSTYPISVLTVRPAGDRYPRLCLRQGYTDTPSGQQYQDVATDNAFYVYMSGSRTIGNVGLSMWTSPWRRLHPAPQPAIL